MIETRVTGAVNNYTRIWRTGVVDDLDPKVLLTMVMFNSNNSGVVIPKLYPAYIASKTGILAKTKYVKLELHGVELDEDTLASDAN